MILAFAAAAAVSAAPTGDSAAVRVNLAGLDQPAARAAINVAARRVCRAVNTDVEGYGWCVTDAARRAHADYQRLQQRKGLVVASTR